MRVAFVPFTAELRIDAELIACAKEQLPPPQQPSEIFFAYQLGDCLKMCHCAASHQYPHSFSAKFKALACDKGPVTHEEKRTKSHVFGHVESDHMLRIFAEAKGTAGFREPETNSLVIHLRLGDMVDMSHADVQTMLLSGANPGAGAARKWPNSIKSVHELLADSAVANVTKVHIVGGGCWRSTRHTGSECIKSSGYARCVRRAFEHQGYNPTLSIDGENADQDFYFMAHAKHFIETSGGFSKIVAQLVTKQGGTVYGRRF